MSFTPRIWQLIQRQIKASIAADPILSSELTSTSPVSHWNLWTMIQALTSNLNEQAQAIFIDEVDTIVSQAYPNTAPWIQSQILLFQYSITAPYLVAITNNTVAYPSIVPSDQIISNCAVTVGLVGIITIKVTTGSPAGALNASQIIALKSYLINFLSPNQKYTLISTTADKLWIAGTIYYNGQLNGSIQGSVVTILNAYISTFSTSQTSGGSFNGVVKVSDIEKIILGVTGVTDWVPSQISITPAVGSQQDLVLANTIIERSFGTYSGYIQEDSGNPFSTTLTFATN